MSEQENAPLTNVNVTEKPSSDAPLEAQISSGASSEKDARATKESATQTSVSEWRVIAETVPGASHVRHNIPNQDAILHVRQSSVGLPIIALVSDGHGSDKCFRSHRGSYFAVRVGAELLGEFVNREHLAPDELETKLRETLPAEYVKRWRALVEADIKREPLSEKEFARLVEKDGERARRIVEANPFLAYGATALAMLLTETFALYLQLGDGEFLIVSEQGEVTQPMPADARLMANETTSLCLEKATQDFRFAVRAHEKILPALILLSTDGYPNSFSSTAGFLQVGGDVLKMLREDGFDSINRSVKGWLEEATMTGSGDDCALVIICRMDALTTKILSSDVSSTDATITTAPVASNTIDAVKSDVNEVTPADSHGQPAPPKTA